MSFDHMNWGYIGLQRRLTGTFGKIPYGLLCPKITSGEAICKVRPTGETASSDVFTGTILVRLLKLRIHSHSVSCATNFVQHAGVEALRNTDEAVEEMAAAFRERRDMLVDLLSDYGVSVPTPQGAFYMMLPVSDDDQSWCEQAIEDAHVATVPGSAFGTPGYARISYANSTERLREAVERLDDDGLLS